MDMDIIYGQIKGNLFECLLWEKGKKQENIIGMMEEFLLDFGKMVNSMDQVYTLIMKNKKIIEFGLMEEETDGQMKINCRH